MTAAAPDPEGVDALRASREFAAGLGPVLGSFGIVPADAELPGQSPTSSLRRQRKSRLADDVGFMTLVDYDGVLRWEIRRHDVLRRPGPRRGPRRGEGPRGQAVGTFKFADLPPNEVGRRLRQLDDRLTGRQGLFEVPKAVLASLGGAAPAPVLGPPAAPPPTGSVLLFVHGTFSSCEHLLAELGATPAGRELLGRALNGGYDKVLAFNHPTVAVSPVLNAATLARCFHGSGAEVDVICHSRGGLVTRWWLEQLDPWSRGNAAAAAGRARVVFAGSPLAGTGLAAPYRLKSALDVLTNVAKGLGLAAKASGVVFPFAAPFAHAAAVLFGMFAKVTTFAAGTPLLDAGVAMIPGLAAQSRVGTNAEILRLRDGLGALPAAERQGRFLDRYWFVQSNFETEDPGWRFWRHFRRAALADRAADHVFEGDNDLVVDTASMADLADGLGAPASGRVLHFPIEAQVHHCNYFRQERTIAHIRAAFGL